MNDVAASGMSPSRYRRVVAVAGTFLALIIFTGAAVRLTESGLGCEDWPTCSEDELVPEWSFHGWIEFGNRLLSGVVAAATIAAVLAGYRRTPRRPDLNRWAWLMVAGVVAQVVLGGITVLVDLHPLFVGAHFLLSVFLMWSVIVLWDKAGGDVGPTIPRVDAQTVTTSRLAVGLSTLVLVTGVAVTGTGPHAGDSRADRLSFDLQSVVRVHSITAWLMVATLVVLALRVGATRGSKAVLAVAVTQGGIGYLQYAIGVPAGLVQLHVIGSIAVFCAVLLHHLSLFDRPTEGAAIDTRRTAVPAQ